MLVTCEIEISTEGLSLIDDGRVQHRISGSTAERFLSLFTPTDLTDLKPMHSTLSCLLHPSGGIVDDTVITRLGPESFYLVTNAACRDKDVAFISQQLSRLKAVDQPHWEILEHQGLLAVQGPLSASILQKVLADSGALTLPDLYFGQCVEAKLRLISGKETLSVLVSRGGYTGEDGFEISIPAEATVAVAQTLLQRGTSDYLRLAGLGARDTLRLEAGMCLYGHDLNDNTTPVEAGLSWIIGKDRRDSSDFNGADVILEQLKPKKAGGGVSKRRIGLVVEGAPAREHATISTVDGEEIGTVTSGCPSPTLGKNIAMGFVKSGFHKVGTSLKVNVRGKLRDSQVVKMPFVPTRYWRQAPGIAPV